MIPEQKDLKPNASSPLNKIRRKLIEYAVPILFLVLCIIGAYYARLQPAFLINEIMMFKRTCMIID